MSWLPWMFIIFITASVSALPPKKIPRLSVLRGSDLGVLRGSPGLRTVSANLSANFQTFFYRQTLDHFNYRPDSYATFQNRYMVNFQYWGGAHAAAPIFVYLGEESNLDDDVGSIGFLVENGARFSALLVYIEVWSLFLYRTSTHYSPFMLDLIGFLSSIASTESRTRLDQWRSHCRMPPNVGTSARVKLWQTTRRWS